MYKAQTHQEFTNGTPYSCTYGTRTQQSEPTRSKSFEKFALCRVHIRSGIVGSRDGDSAIYGDLLNAPDEVRGLQQRWRLTAKILRTWRKPWSNSKRKRMQPLSTPVCVTLVWPWTSELRCSKILVICRASLPKGRTGLLEPSIAT